MMKALGTLILQGFLAIAVAVSSNVTAAQPSGFSQPELDQILAPVALYPDTVLSHVLIAATYPLEVVQAARWSRSNPGFSGQDAVSAVENRDWDPSVKALAAFPELLARMDQDIDWTQRLGDAFIVQEEQVIATIQNLRAQAYAQGNLHTNEQVRVVRETEYIYIEPAQSHRVYVPYYDPRVVYGPRYWSDYPPVYWPYPPGYSYSLGFYWGIGYAVAPAFYFSAFHWPHRQVVVVDHHDRYGHDGHRYPRRDFRSSRDVASYDGARRWQHNPRHRRGVSHSGDVDNGRFVRSTNHFAMGSSPPVRAATPRDAQRVWASDQRYNLTRNAGSARPGTIGRSRLQHPRQGDDEPVKSPERSIPVAALTPRAVTPLKSEPGKAGRRGTSDKIAPVKREATNARQTAPNRPVPSTRSMAPPPQRSATKRSAEPVRSKAGQRSVKWTDERGGESRRR